MDTHPPNDDDAKFGWFDSVGELLGNIALDGLIELIGSIIGAFSDC
jgi:hypothetical protein